MTAATATITPAAAAATLHIATHSKQESVYEAENQITSPWVFGSVQPQRTSGPFIVLKTNERADPAASTGLESRAHFEDIERFFSFFFMLLLFIKPRG